MYTFCSDTMGYVTYTTLAAYCCEIMNIFALQLAQIKDLRQESDESILYFATDDASYVPKDTCT